MQYFKLPSQVCISAASFDGAILKAEADLLPSKVFRAFSVSEKQIRENSSPTHF